MTNILEELKEIMKDDNEHNVELNLDFTGLTVYLDLATEDNCTEMYMIPIKYDVLEDCIHIPYREFVEKYDESADIGTTYEEVKLIQKIMNWMNTHKSIISEICLWTDCERRNQRHFFTLYINYLIFKSLKNPNI